MSTMVYTERIARHAITHPIGRTRISITTVATFHLPVDMLELPVNAVILAGSFLVYLPHVPAVTVTPLFIQACSV
jgi:hypothetical protein